MIPESLPTITGIRKKREWWFKVAARKYPYDSESLLQSVESVDRELIAAEHDPNAIPKLSAALADYVLNMLSLINPENARGVVDMVMEAIPLDTGVLLPKHKVAFEDFCQCERLKCVGSRDKVYCYWSKDLSAWVLAKRLYWRCYDEIVECAECGFRHKRGHVRKEGVCRYASQEI